MKPSSSLTAFLAVYFPLSSRRLYRVKETVLSSEDHTEPWIIFNLTELYPSKLDVDLNIGMNGGMDLARYAIRETEEKNRGTRREEDKTSRWDRGR